MLERSADVGGNSAAKTVPPLSQGTHPERSVSRADQRHSLRRSLPREATRRTNRCGLGPIHEDGLRRAHTKKGSCTTAGTGVSPCLPYREIECRLSAYSCRQGPHRQTTMGGPDWPLPLRGRSAAFAHTERFGEKGKGKDPRRPRSRTQDENHGRAQAVRQRCCTEDGHAPTIPLSY